MEPHSLKLRNRFLPYFSMAFVVLLLIFLFASMFVADGFYFEKVIGFVSALIGSITAYYFGGKSSQVVTVEKKAADSRR